MKRLFFIIYLFICPFLSMGQDSNLVSVSLPGRTVSAYGVARPSIKTQESEIVMIHKCGSIK